MKALPFHRFTIHSPLSPADAIEALRAHLEPRKIMRWSGPQDKARFQGEIERNTFSMTRIIGYRNSFLPVIRGEAAPERRGSAITITMQLHVVVLVFMAVWMTIAVTAAFGAIAAIASGGFSAIILIPLVMVAFGYGMVQFGFWFEATPQEATLRRIFRETA